MSIYIDYNAEMSDGRYSARLSRLETLVSVGQVLQTSDEDRNRLVMVVDGFDETRGLVYLRPDWTTWVDDAASGMVDGLEIASSGGFLEFIDVEAREALDKVFGPNSPTVLSGSILQYA